VTNREAVDLGQKLFLTSIIPFIAPHSSVQVIVAVLFSFGERACLRCGPTRCALDAGGLCSQHPGRPHSAGMVLFTIQVKPFRERANNQLVSLSMASRLRRKLTVHACFGAPCSRLSRPLAPRSAGEYISVLVHVSQYTIIFDRTRKPT
jgi:hypothetical protein